MVIFLPGVDYPHDNSALTLYPSEVTDTEEDSDFFEKTHESGWTIKGYVYEDWYVWVNDFEAYHPLYGTLKGDFEKEIQAESREAFDHFWKHHEPQAWDYGDI